MEVIIKMVCKRMTEKVRVERKKRWYSRIQDNSLGTCTYDWVSECCVQRGKMGRWLRWKALGILFASWPVTGLAVHQFPPEICRGRIKDITANTSCYIHVCVSELSGEVTARASSRAQPDPMDKKRRRENQTSRSHKLSYHDLGSGKT